MTITEILEKIGFTSSPISIKRDILRYHKTIQNGINHLEEKKIISPEMTILGFQTKIQRMIYAMEGNIEAETRF